jgi:hypothetical protein
VITGKASQVTRGDGEAAPVDIIHRSPEQLVAQ